MQDKFEEIVESFITNRVGISDQFLSVRLAFLLHEHLLKLRMDDVMTSAGIGNGNNQALNATIRSDKIQWMDKKNKHEGETGFLDYIEDFIGYLNKTCYTGINAYEFHYAVYESGSAYKRHKDQFQSDSNRKYSLVSYLNSDWVTQDGGELCVYQDGIGQTISPNNRKSVFFQSDELEHEVMPVNKLRMSITGWLKRI